MARQRLLELLDTDDTSGVTLVSAPAGYGKTTFLSQHFAASLASGHETSWLTLDESMQDVQVYRNWLWLALTGKPERPLGEGLLPGMRAMSSHEFLRVVAHRIEQSDSPFILYLDDFHRAESDEVLAFTDELIPLIAGRAHIVIASRSRPRLKLGRLAASGVLRELGAQHLAFTESEAQVFLGATVPRDQVQRLVQRMEGWVAGIQLFRFMSEVEVTQSHVPAAGATAGGNNPLINIDQVSGRRSHIAQYLAEQVFESLDARTQEFVLKTSILDCLSGDLADAVTDRLDGWFTLEWLQDHNLFLFAIDTDNAWYRYHQLFREFLQERLRRTQPGAVCGLHRKAADWLAQKNMFRDALVHAYATKDHEFLGKIASMAGGWRLTLADGISIWKPLEGIAAERANLHPSLQLAHVYYLLQTGRVALGKRVFERLRRDLNDCNSQVADLYHGFDLDCELVDLLIAVLEDEPWPADRVALLERRLEEEVGLDPKLAVVAHELLGWICYWSGEFEKGVVASELCLRRCIGAGASYIQTYAHMARAGNCLALAKLDEAEIAFTEAKLMAGRILGPNCDQALASDALRSEILLERGFFGHAESLVQPLLGIIDTTELWVDLACTAYKVRARCILEAEGIDAALQVLLEGRTIFRDRALPRFLAVMDLYEIRLLLLAGRLEDARARAVQFELLRKAGDRTQLREKGWRIAIPLLTEMARLALAEQDPETARDHLEALNDWIGNCNAHFHVLELKLLCGWAHEMSGARDSACQAVIGGLSVAAETGQVLGFLDSRAWIRPVLRDIAMHHLVSDPDLYQRLQDIREQLDPAGTPCQGPASSPAPAGLSPREQQVFCLLCDGLTSKEIARSLDITVNTAMGYRKSVYRKLGASSRSDIVTISRSLSPR
ncbi:MAG: LuxR C-terminal-related transcriptional regulator [Haliea sp.]